MGSIAIHWPVEVNEHGRPLLWFGSWLTGSAGFEGGWFYSGCGGESAEYPIPANATGVRIRRWPNEGLDAEYADVLAVDRLAELSPAALDFDAPQPFSRLDDGRRSQSHTAGGPP